MICFPLLFAGNDFLPHLPLDIREGGIETPISEYDAYAEHGRIPNGQREGHHTTNRNDRSAARAADAVFADRQDKNERDKNTARGAS